MLLCHIDRVYLACRYTRFHTAEEVAKHNKDGDCWLIVKNKVYDVSEYLSSHPGGKDKMLKWGGKEATKAVLENIPHPDNIEVTLERFYIGPLKS